MVVTHSADDEAGECGARGLQRRPLVAGPIQSIVPATFRRRPASTVAAVILKSEATKTPPRSSIGEKRTAGALRGLRPFRMTGVRRLWFRGAKPGV